MENVSEALKMGAGMLMAVLLIVLLVYMFGSISNLENTKSDKEIQEQNSEFNQRFLAFDRTSMYGTDVISAIGLAISNNKIYNQSIHANPLGNYEPNADYSMNIEFEIKQNIISRKTEEVYKLEDINGDGILDKNYDADGCHPAETKSEKKILEAGTHDLIFSNNIYQKTGNEYEEYKAIEEIALTGDQKEKVTTKQQGTKLRVIREDHTGYSELKSVIFECTEVRYNQTGRVYFMKFKAK